MLVRPLIALCLLAPLVANAAKPDQRETLLDALADELARSMERLELEDHDKPYFIEYRLVDHDGVDVEARFGAVTENERDHGRMLYVDVRVGDYGFDSNPDAEDTMFGEPMGFRPAREAPLDDDPAALRATAWLLTDRAYKDALASYLQKRAKKVTKVVDKHVDSFSKESPSKHMDPAQPLIVDQESWAALMRRVSAKFKQDKSLLEGSVHISADRTRVSVVNSEGTRIINERVIYALSINAVGQAPDGMLLEQGETLYADSQAGLPDEATVDKLVDQALTNLKALAAAPVADPYTGPAILEPEATGVFFHETIGHRLEGERQNDENEGRTFKGQLGTAIMPDFISIYDDPSLVTLGGARLNGHYRFDDQGVPSRRVDLVTQGELKTFLTSRTPVEGVNLSNGHGRAQSVNRPMARMGNLVVESHRKMSRAKLKERLLAEVRKQGKPYGLIIRDITGGSTNTSNYGYQAFKGTPRMVYKVDAKTGDETLVRGVEMVGTPLTVINKIIATSDEVGVFNGFCGAESGYVPVSAVAPATLFSEIELQRSQRDKERAPILSPPWKARGAHPPH